MTFQEALLRQHVPHRQGGSDRAKFHVNCPWCAERGKPPDTKYRLCVHAVAGWGRCLHCGWKSRNAVAQVLKRLGVAERVDGFESQERRVEPELVTLPDDFQPLTRACDDLDRQARQYVLRRGVTPEQIQQTNVGVSFSGRYAYRVIFPVYVGGELKAVNARDFTGASKIKYLNSRGDKWLFNFDPKADACVLSEGAFKSLIIARIFRGTSAALLGHDLTENQAGQIRQSVCKQVFIYPDPDAPGVRGAVNVAEKLLELGLDVKIAWPVLQPADEAPVKDVQRALANALEYNWSTRQKLLLSGR